LFYVGIAPIVICWVIKLSSTDVVHWPLAHPPLPQGNQRQPEATGGNQRQPNNTMRIIHYKYTPGPFNFLSICLVIPIPRNKAKSVLILLCKRATWLPQNGEVPPACAGSHSCFSSPSPRISFDETDNRPWVDSYDEVIIMFLLPSIN